ncbi:MAG TPA: RNA polymerase sigma factor [Ktedonobacteraceae bacterium]|nr:RNA polymerase sigma factor [Ktedonobacteraceae bacterium]
MKASADFPIDRLRTGPMRCQWHRADITVRACQKDRVAFSLLYEYYKRPLGRRLVALVNNQETVYDLYQDTFVRAWQYASPAIAGHFEPWLYSVARNLAIDYIRHATMVQLVPLASDEWQTAEQEIDSSWHEDQLIEMLLIKDVFAEMSPQYRVCLLLHVHWGFKQREIAERLGIAEKTVSTNISRAYKQLNRIYSEHDVIGELPTGIEIPLDQIPSPSVLPPITTFKPYWASDLDFLKGPSPRLQQLWVAEDRSR